MKNVGFLVSASLGRLFRVMGVLMSASLEVNLLQDFVIDVIDGGCVFITI